jgi:hypothetical protein
VRGASLGYVTNSKVPLTVSTTTMGPAPGGGVATGAGVVAAGAGFAGAGLAGGFAWEASSGTAINRLAKASNEVRLNIGVRLPAPVEQDFSPVHHESRSS